MHHNRFSRLLRKLRKAVGRLPPPPGDPFDAPLPVLLEEHTRVPDDLRVGLVIDKSDWPYWDKWKRYLENNAIPFDEFEVHKSSWLEEARKFDLILWRPWSAPWTVDEAREKVYVLEKSLGKLVYPSFDEVFFYENKALQYYLLQQGGFPIIDTFISHDREEALRWLAEAEFPLVSKIRTASSSLGTQLLGSRAEAIRLVERVFSRKGSTTYWPSLNQKGYVLFQPLVPNPGSDIRVMVSDRNHIHGYYRYAQSGDFRASGNGIVRFQALPKECIRVAVAVKEHLGFDYLAVDFLKSAHDEAYYIIECSNFVQIEYSGQLAVDGVTGRYSYDPESDRLKFIPGEHWPQELLLDRLIRKNFSQCVAVS